MSNGNESISSLQSCLKGMTFLSCDTLAEQTDMTKAHVNQQSCRSRCLNLLRCIIIHPAPFYIKSYVAYFF